MRLATLTACLAMAACSQPASEPASAPTPPAAPVAPVTPPTAPGAELSPTDPVRAQAQTALDAAVSQKLGVPAKVGLEIVRGEGDWVFASGPATTPAGGEIDLSKTTMAEAADQGMTDGTGVIALLKRAGATWTVVELSIGSTDVPQVGWPQQYGVSPALVGQEEAEGGDE